MFEILLLMSVVLIVVGQLLPEAGNGSQLKPSAKLAKAGASSNAPRAEDNKRRKTKKQQPCQRVSSRAVIGTMSQQITLRF